jgi:hypothetical protein
MAAYVQIGSPSGKEAKNNIIFRLIGLWQNLDVHIFYRGSGSESV